MQDTTQFQNIWYDIQISTDDKSISFWDSLYEKLNNNLQRLHKPDTNHPKQHTMQQQDYVELYKKTQNVTPIAFSKKETQISIPDRQLSFVEARQIIP